MPSGGYIFPRFLQVMIALWIAVRLPTTANHSIIMPSQLSSNPNMSKDAYCPSATHSMTYWIRGNSVERTTRSALPSSPAYSLGAPMAWAWVPMYEVSRTPTRASIPRYGSHHLAQNATPPIMKTSAYLSKTWSR